MIGRERNLQTFKKTHANSLFWSLNVVVFEWRSRRSGYRDRITRRDCLVPFLGTKHSLPLSPPSILFLAGFLNLSNNTCKYFFTQCRFFKKKALFFYELYVRFTIFNNYL